RTGAVAAVSVSFLTRSSPAALYTLSLHDALPIYVEAVREEQRGAVLEVRSDVVGVDRPLRLVRREDDDDVRRGDRLVEPGDLERSEEHTSELQSRENLVCRLLLEKKKITRRLGQQ